MSLKTEIAQLVAEGDEAMSRKGANPYGQEATALLVGVEGLLKAGMSAEDIKAHIDRIERLRPLMMRLVEEVGADAAGQFFAEMRSAFQLHHQ